MKKFAFSVMVGLAALGFVAVQPAQALTTTGTVNVNVSLFPKCELTPPTGTLVLRYVSFQTSASENTADFSVMCTSTLPFSVSVAATSGTIAGLTYNLAVLDAGNSVVNSGVGNGTTVVPMKIRGTIAANLSGTCASDSSGTPGSQDAAATGTTGGVGTACTGTAAAHTITVTY